MAEGQPMPPQTQLPSYGAVTSNSSDVSWMNTPNSNTLMSQTSPYPQSDDSREALYSQPVGAPYPDGAPYPQSDGAPYPQSDGGMPYPQPGAGTSMTGVYPSEPPPKYEPPKDGAYSGGDYNGYPPQQPGYYGQQPGTSGYQSTTNAPQYPPTVQTVVVTQVGYGPTPRTVVCPNCHANITTSISYQTGSLTWLAAGLLCLFGCWCGCSCAPFCMDGTKDVVHICPNCHQTVGVYRRM